MTTAANGRPSLPAGVVPGGRFDDWHGTVPRFIACDVDGTLLGREATATRRIERSIVAARALGLRIGLATGRTRLGAESIRAQLQIEGPNVFHDGAEIHDGVRTVDAFTLDVSEVDALLRLGRAFDAYVEIYTADSLYVSSLDERAEPHWEMLGMWPSGVLTRAEPLAADAVMKGTIVLFHAPDGHAEALAEAIGEVGLRVGPSRSPRTPGLDYLNITNPLTDKGHGVERAAREIGVEPPAIMAIGDAHNDLPLLELAGTAVAMGQAPDALRRVAHLVVPDVDDDGVAHALALAMAWHHGASPSDHAPLENV